MNIWDTGKEFVTRAATGGVYGSSDLDSLTGGGGSGSSALDLIPGIGDARAQERANQINIEQAELNRKFQERMSSTAYQRAMADMKKAGLNPTLAYMQGGASAPSGSQATVQSASKAGLGEFAMNAAMGIQKILERLQPSSLKLVLTNQPKHLMALTPPKLSHRLRSLAFVRKSPVKTFLRLNSVQRSANGSEKV